MKKQLITLGIIGILIAISISGCLENKESNGGVTTLSGEVTVTTDNREYEQNETINITLYNGLNISIYSFITGYPTKFFIEQVEKRTSLGEWVVYLPLLPLTGIIPYTGEVQSGQSFSFEWEPIAMANGSYNYSILEFGLYRIKSGYNLSENNTWQTVYSNEFYIEKEKALQYITTNLENVIITLSREGCYGECPVYNLTIYGNGTVIYDGYYFVNTTGKHITNISEEKIHELISYFEKIDYFSLNNMYGWGGALDLPYAVTSLTINGKTKTINNDGTSPAPRELSELEDKIDEFVNSSQWID